MRVKTFDDFSDGLDVRKPKNLDNDESLRNLVNAYITQGETIERRPGLKAVCHGGLPKVKNLCAFDGRLHVFTENGTPGEKILDNGVKLIIWKISYDAGKACQPDPFDVIGNPSSPEPSYVNFCGGFLSGMYVSVKWDNGRSLHYFIPNPRKMYSGTINPIADSKCPHTSKVAIAQSKIYAVGDMDADGIGKADTVVYSATANYDKQDKPVWDGEANDIGFLPTGDRSLGNSQATGLGVISNRLVVFHEDACQIWALDPDPARNELEEQVAGIGTEHYQSIVTANKDIYFLSSVGVRSIGGQSMYRNMKGSDVGSAIDNLIKVHIQDHDGNWDGQFFPGAGQYWLTAGNETYVLTKSQRDKLNAWSIYRFSQHFHQMAHLAENLYAINGANGYMYMLDEGTSTDGYSEQDFNVEMETPFYSFGQEGQFKLFQSMEVILEGFGTIDHCVNPNNNDDRTASFQIVGDTRTVPTLPLGILAPTLSTRIKGKGSELKSINSLIYRYQQTNAGV